VRARAHACLCPASASVESKPHTDGIALPAPAVELWAVVVSGRRERGLRAQLSAQHAIDPKSGFAPLLVGASACVGRVIPVWSQTEPHRAQSPSGACATRDSCCAHDSSTRR
jgi:hypothetical protein